MSKSIENQTSSFWQGFTFGIAAAAGVGYLLGTKSGRKKLQTLIEYLEQYDGNSDGMLSFIEQLIKTDTKQSEENNKTASQQSSLDAVLNKVKSITQS